MQMKMQPLTHKPAPKEPMSILKEKLKKVVHKIIALNYDYVLVVTGDEGVGKTSCAIQLCKEVDPGFTEEQVAYNVDHFEMLINKLEPGQALLIDEGAMAFTRDAMSKDVKFIIKTLTKCRKLRLFIVICVPKFELLDKYIRMHRTKTIIRVVKRGRYFVYNKGRVKLVLKYMAKPYKFKKPKPMFKESFRDCANVYPKLWKACIDKNKAEFNRVPVGDKGVKPTEFTLDVRHVAKIIGCDTNTIRNRTKFLTEGEHFIWLKNNLGVYNKRKFSPKVIEFLQKLRENLEKQKKKR